VPLESLWTLVGEVATDLTVVADVQSVQFIQPVRNWLKQEKQTHNSVPQIQTIYMVRVKLKETRTI
jgi:hypothetical protein